MISSNPTMKALVQVGYYLCACALAWAPSHALAQPQEPAPQCGHWAILRCCELLGVQVNMTDLLKRLPPDTRGHNMYALSKTLSRIGFRVEGRKETFDRLMAGPYPIIAHLNPDHFVVVVRTDNGYVYLFDGTGRRRVLPAHEFTKQWTQKTLRVQRDLGETALPRFLSRKTGDPCVQFDTLIIDKGEIADVGEGITYTFPFHNFGGGDLTIQKVTTNCGCLKSQKPAKPIPPGGQDQIALTFTVSRGSGPFSHKALVQTNDPTAPMVRLTASGNTSRAISIEPSRLVLGRVVCGREKKTTFYVAYTGDTPLNISNIEWAGAQGAVKWRILEIGAVKNCVPAMRDTAVFARRNMCVLEVSFTPKLEDAGKIEGKLWVRTNIKDFARISVPVVADVVQPVVFSPESLLLHETATTSVLRQTVTAWSPEGDRFRVAGINSADTGLEATYSEGDAERIEVCFLGKTSEVRAAAGREVTVFIKLQDNTEAFPVRLPVYTLTTSQ